MQLNGTAIWWVEDETKRRWSDNNRRREHGHQQHIRRYSSKRTQTFEISCDQMGTIIDAAVKRPLNDRRIGHDRLYRTVREQSSPNTLLLIFQHIATTRLRHSCRLTCTILFCFWQNQNFLFWQVKIPLQDKKKFCFGFGFAQNQNKTQNRAGQLVVDRHKRSEADVLVVICIRRRSVIEYAL